MGNYFDQFDEVDPNKIDRPDYKSNYFDRFDEEEGQGSAITSLPGLPFVPSETFARHAAEPTVRGVVNLLEFPITIGNAALSVGYALAEKDNPPLARPLISEGAEKIGIIAPEEERADSWVARGAEFLGAGYIPAAATLKYGAKALDVLSPVPTALQQMGRATAANPGKATAFDVAASFLAAGIGEVARQNTDNELVIAMAELSGAFIPSAVVLIPQVASKVTLSGKIADWVKKTIFPFTESGGKIAASNRIQSVAADPQATAAALDPNSPIPPMQQSNDPGLLKLQSIILKRNPKLNKEFSDELRKAKDQLAKSFAFEGGDVERAVHLLNIRQQQAVEEAALAVAKLKPDAGKREISTAARRAVQSALDDAIDIEKAVWNRLDKTAPATVDNASEALATEIARRSPDADPADIPRWLQSTLTESPLDPKLAASLEKQGMLIDGAIDPAIMSALERQGILKTRQRTLNDLIAIRGRVLRDIREEKAQLSPNRNKIRILNDVQSSLLDDMTATGADGVDEARAFSNALNDRFRRGRVGRLLGFDKTGAERVAEEDLLESVVFGPASATTTKRFVEMANEAPEMTINYIKARYVEAVFDEKKANVAAHNTFVKDLRRKGMFDVFPELEGQLNAAKKASLDSLKLDVPDSQINTSRINRNQSRAALFLQANPGEEMKMVLDSKNPVGAIRDIMKTRIHGGKILADDYSAVQGLKNSFAEEIFIKSGGKTADIEGNVIPNGAKLKALLKEYRPTMRALHMNDAEINRLERVAENIRLGQMRAADIDIGTTIMDSGLSRPIDFISRWVGARTGGRLGEDMGSTLVLAGYMSKQARESILNMTASKAEKLIIQATSDPELFRSLLVGPRASDQAKKKAAEALEKAILRSESIGVTAIGIASSQEEQ